MMQHIDTMIEDAIIFVDVNGYKAKQCIKKHAGEMEKKTKVDIKILLPKRTIKQKRA